MKNKDKTIQKWAKRLFALSLDANGKLSDQRVREVLRVTEESPPRNYKKILKQYLKYIEREVANNIAIVEHAGIVNPNTLKRVHDKMNTYYNRELQFVQKVNKNLLAGMRVRIGDDIWDISALGRLNKLSEAC